MRPNEFLRLVVPSDGFYIVATPVKIQNTNRMGWWNRVEEDIPAVLARRQEWQQGQKDIYFALASYSERFVWNPIKLNRKTNKPGAKEYRTHGNAKSLKSLFIDLDVDPTKPEKKYVTQRAAITALMSFCATLKLPKPLLVNSGYGVHVYWPATEAISRDAWVPIAEKLKAAATHFGLRQDLTVTSDTARVLRLPGTTNYKHGTTAPVVILNDDPDPTTFAELDRLLDAYLLGNNVPVARPRPPMAPGGTTPSAGGNGTSLAGPAPAVAGLAGNLGPTSDPLNGNLVVYGCPAMAKLVSTRGANADYQQWLAGLSLARYCEDAPLMALAVSDGHAEFNQTECMAKMATLNAGPTKCSTFWNSDQATCQGCTHWGKIKSPAEIGRTIRISPSPNPVVHVPDLPYGYMRLDGKDGKYIVLREQGDNNEYKDHLICQYDIYPKRILEQTDETEADERSVWTVVLPRKGDFDFRMQQSVLSDPRKLHAFLLSRGVHVGPGYIKGLQTYMTAYLHELAKSADRERMFERLGWHNDHTAFVMADKVYYRDGTTTPHILHRALVSATKGSLHTAGTQQGWTDAIRFYGGDGNEPYRAFFYAELGGILLHMTTHKGVLITASGDTGRGKTTLLEACYSFWGDPTGGCVGGGQYGTTLNALWEHLGMQHSIPLHWDDTTERDADEMRKFMLHIPTGRGKERMHGNTHDGKVVTWETFVLSSTNTDDVHRILSTGKDSDPHLMRFISIPFHGAPGDVDAKQRADHMKKALRRNYGWGATVYLPFVVRNYEKIQAIMDKQGERFDRLLNATSEERHWSASLTAMYVGGLLGYQLGLLPFSPDDDLDWLLAHFGGMRSTYKQASSTSADVMNEFLESHISNTLVLSPKLASNVDNVIRLPHGGLFVRHEVDKDRIYVAKHKWSSWCSEVRANQAKVENELITQRVILRKSCFKVLAADTPQAMGQTRCLEIDRVALMNAKGKP